MGRRPKLVNDKKTRLYITLTPQQKAKALRISEVTGVSISEFLGDAIDKEYKRLQRKHGKDFSIELPIPGQMTLDDVQ